MKQNALLMTRAGALWIWTSAIVGMTPVQGTVHGMRKGAQMNKSNLKPGKKYLHKQKTTISGREMEAERWLRCEEITPDGAIFSRDFEPEIELTDKEIREELIG